MNYKNSHLILFKKTSILILIIIMILYFFWSLFFRNNFHVESYSNETSVKINIKNESNLKDVIMILTKNGDIKDLWSFKLISFLKKYNKNIRSGDISLNGKYTNNNLINILRMPSREVVNLRIPENIRLLKDMIILIEDSMGFWKR